MPRKLIVTAFAALFGTLGATAQAQVTTRLQASDPNFRLAGVYLGSTVYTADVFSLFETNGIRRVKWQSDGTLADEVTNTEGSTAAAASRSWIF